MKIKISRLDKLFSTYIRLRDKGICQRCLQYQGIKGGQNSHYHSRRKRSTRYDPDNCCLLCFGCHTYFHGEHLEYTQFMIQRLGEQGFDMLNCRARTLARYVDESAVELYFQAKIAEVLKND